MENLDPTILLTKLMDEYEQKFIKNRAEIDRLETEREMLQTQIHHLEALILGHQELTQGQERLVYLVAPQSPPPTPHQEKKRPSRLFKAGRSISTALLKEQYQGMSVLTALLKVLHSSPGEFFTIDQLSTAVFMNDRSQKVKSELNNLVSKELSRGVKEGRVSRVPKTKGCYVCEVEQAA